MRDLAVRVSDAYRRADQLIAMRVGSHAGGMLDDIAKAQSEFASKNAKGALLDWQRPDMTKFAEREKAWQETGVAPGIAQPELAKEIADVKTAAANAKPEPKPEKPPKDWGDPEKAAEKAAGEAGAAGKPEGATTAPTKTETPTAAPPKGETATPAPQGGEKIIDLSGMGKGVSDGLYKTIFDALQGADNSAARIRDPLIERARPAFERGLIQSPDDLRKLVQAGYDVDKAGLREAAFPGLDMTKLLPEERAELDAAQAEVAKAEHMEGAFEEAAMCLKAG